MPKRFTDSDKWRQKWFRELTLVNKLFLFYLSDNCDHAGIWEVDFGLASYQLGLELDEEEIRKTFADKITVFDSDQKWFINDFLPCQYGSEGLNEENKVHKSVLKILRKHGLEELGRALAGPKDKRKAKALIMETDKNKARVYSLPSQYCSKHDLKHTEVYCPKCVEEF